MLESEFRNIAIHQVRMAAELPTDNENTVNGFAGEFAFSDHNLVPECLRDFLMESFPKRDAFRKIPLDDINGLLNAVWQGPGSIAKLKMYRTQLEETNRLGSPVAPVTEDTTVEEFIAARENYVDTV
mgnify:FL=1